MSILKIYIDGASRGNPGPAGIGIVIYNESDSIIKIYKEYIGRATNNQAEYRALIKSLELIKKLKHYNKIETIRFYSDSELMVKQINFDYRIREPELALLNNKFHVESKKRLSKKGINWKIEYISRDENRMADRAANLSIEKRLKRREDEGNLFF